MAFSPADEDALSLLQAPVHPVPQLQGPFEESMLESAKDMLDVGPKIDPVARRTMLLDQPTYQRICAGKWKQKPGEKYHPLWKISAQMSFGIHLLSEGLAKSDEEVLKILQTHVDDVDGFLESTTEDFDLAQTDVEERLRYLQLPLQHAEVFDKMLEDRAFRASIVDGNEKIEHIVERTSEAMKDALKDVQKGLQATKALGKYLRDLAQSMKTRESEHHDVITAMQGNVEGWFRAFSDLHKKGAKLGSSLVQLAAIVSEMQRRVGVASRKALITMQAANLQSAYQIPVPQVPSERNSPSIPVSRPKTSKTPIPNKPLPVAPDKSSVRLHSPGRPSAQGQRSRTQSPLVSQSPFLDQRRIQENRSIPKNQVKDVRREVKIQSPAQDLRQKLGSPQRSNMAVSPEILSVDANGSLTPSAYSPSSSSYYSPQLNQTQLKQPLRHVQEKAHAPIELPAHVPEAKGAEVPPNRDSPSPSVANMTRERSGDNMLKSVNLKTVGAHLKSPLSSRNTSSPTGSTSQNGANQSPIVSISRASPDQRYFASTTPDLAPSNTSSPRNTTPSSASSPSRSAGGPSSSARRIMSNNPTFTSHPPNMDMARSPPLQQLAQSAQSKQFAQVPAVRAIPELDSKHTSYQSSLGEPGPEIAADGLPEIVRSPLIAELDGSTSISPAPVELDSYTPPPSGLIELEAPQYPTSANIGVKLDPSNLSISNSSQSPKELENERRDQNAKRGLVSSPPYESAFATDRRSFRLPPAQGSRLSSGKDDNQAHQQTGKTLPSTGTDKESPSSTTINLSPIPEASQFQSTSATKDLGQSAPIHADLMDYITFTPPGSPIHERHVSTGSSNSAANSARLVSFRASTDLAPPEEAPPPPGPGGRRMVTPDYATAGAFEGERRSRRSGASSLSSIKKIFSPGSLVHSRSSSLRVVDATDEVGGWGAVERGVSKDVEMLTSTGNDVLWFKGMSKDGIWVASS